MTTPDESSRLLGEWQSERMDWIESLAERRIREALARGEFDDLPGAGKPLDLTDAGDPDWWVKRLARRESIDATAVIPATLALRREAEGFPESLADLTQESQVRAVLADFNERVRADWRRPASGPSWPLAAYEVDVASMVDRWRRRQGLESAIQFQAADHRGGTDVADRFASRPTSWPADSPNR